MCVFFYFTCIIHNPATGLLFVVKIVRIIFEFVQYLVSSGVKQVS